MLHVMVAAATAWIFIALAAALALVVTAAAARAQGRRLEHRMVAELGRRWDQQQQMQHMSENVPDAAPAVDDMAPELQVTLEELLSQRDVLLEEFQAVQAQISMLKKRVERRRPVTAVADDDEAVVQLHDVLPEEWAERRRR